jgi:hypothetical protein
VLEIEACFSWPDCAWVLRQVADVQVTFYLVDTIHDLVLLSDYSSH